MEEQFLLEGRGCGSFTSPLTSPSCSPSFVALISLSLATRFVLQLWSDDFEVNIYGKAQYLPRPMLDNEDPIRGFSFYLVILILSSL